MQKYCPCANLRRLSYFVSKSVNLVGPKVAWENIETESRMQNGRVRDKFDCCRQICAYIYV